MAEVLISKGSWLNRSRLFEFQGALFWDQTEYPEIPININDRYITIDRTMSKRIDLIADSLYGDSDLWWVIMVANNLQYPNDLLEGQSIRIPPRSEVDKLLVQQQ